MIYFSLVGPLMGLYLPVECDDENEARLAMNERLRGLWCSTYTREQACECVRRYGGLVLPDEFRMRV